ncbi:hypothetical protein EI555_011571, partial [Monodon monoceros]
PSEPKQVSSPKEEVEEGHEKWKSNHSGPGGRTPGGSRRRPHRVSRSPPPAVTRPAAPCTPRAPRLLGPSQSPGSTGSPAPFSGPAATGPEDPSAPLELAAAPGRPNPRFPSTRPRPPFPGRVSGAAPLLARALTPPSRAPKARGSTPLQPLLLLTPPAAHRYLRVANTTDPAAGRTRGGRAGAREGRRLQAGRAEGTPTPPGGDCGGRGPQELAPSGSEWRGRDQASALTSPHSPVPGPASP